MKLPIILINFKAYEQSFGPSAHQIAQSAQVVSEESGVTIGVCPMAMELRQMSQHYSIPVFAQHIDGILPGAHTGFALAEAVHSIGAKGTLINHSEHRLTLADVEAAVEAAKRTHLTSVVCTNNTPTSAAAAVFGPDFVAIEPPELIGSGISVSTADPEVITASVKAVQNINPDVRVLAGAGIHSGTCVKTALDLGSDGVLLASGVVKAENPEDVLRDLVSKI